MRVHLALLICIFTMSCKFAGKQAVVGEDGAPGSAEHGADSGVIDSSAEGGFFGSPAPLGSGNGSSAHVAATATYMIGKENCSLFPPKMLKCAQQASDILRSAGVGIKGSLSVNGLVSQLRAIGWREIPGPCPPGSVQHTAGIRPGRHIGVVGTDGKAVHNSSSRGSSWRCGRLFNHEYKSWNRRARCLVAPN